MTRPAGMAVLALLLAIAAGGAAGRPAAAPGADSTDAWSATHVLVERLEAAGRAEVQLERTVVDPLSGRPETLRGELALEPPDRAAIRFPATGERVTLRSDGGEWLQPQLHQMLRLGAERARAARRWWDVLLPERKRRIAARRLGPRRFLMIAGEASGRDSAWVWLDGSGLPERLEVGEGNGERTRYRFKRWRFSKPRGPAAFVLEAPSDYQVVELP